MRSERVIDSLRGASAAVVVVHHIAAVFPASLAELDGTIAGMAVTAISDANTKAVMLFFIISGYCISGSLARRGLRDWADLRSYAVRRAIRIVPPYWLALTMTAILVGIIDPSDPTLGRDVLLGNLLFLQTSANLVGTWFPPFGSNGPLWSISYEVFYYWLFPVAAIFSRWMGLPLASLGAAAVISLSAAAANTLVPNPIMSFVSLYLVWNAGASIQQSAKNANRFPRTFLMLCSVIASLIIGLSYFKSDTGALILSGCWIAMVWLLVERFSHSFDSRLVYALSDNAFTRMFAWMGGVSYGLYLSHFPILMSSRATFGDSPLGIAIGLCASAGAAILIERLAIFPKKWFLTTKPPMANGEKFP